MKREVVIYCDGQRTTAWYSMLLERWKCRRCGKPVKVVT